MTQSNENKQVNIWKYLFLGLLGFLLIPIVILLFSGKSGEINTQEYPYRENDLAIQLEVDILDVETIANVYLQKETDNSTIDYVLQLDEKAHLIGQSSYLGIPFDFKVEMTPQTLDNGNLLLNIGSITLSGFELPRNLVLTLLANQLEFPEFVVFNPDDSYIGVNLNEFELENGGRIRVEQFDLDQDTIQASILLPNEAIQ